MDQEQQAKLLRDAARAIALRMTSDPNEADDVAQEAMVAYLLRPPREPEAAAGWLRTVVRNIVSKRHRGTTRRRQRDSLLMAPPPAKAASTTAADREAAAQLSAAVEELPEPYRSTIRAAYHEGLTTAAIAHREGVPYETARARLRRGLQRLRRALGRTGDGPRRDLRVTLPPGPCPTSST